MVFLSASPTSYKQSDYNTAFLSTSRSVVTSVALVRLPEQNVE
jgi:hypothetical protein